LGNLAVDVGLRELEIVWRERMKDAYGIYLERQTEAHELSTRTAVLDSFGPDGVFAIRQARSRELAALKEYVRIVRIYTNLVLHGIKPDDDPKS
jgi:hypothetical protein